MKKKPDPVLIADPDPAFLESIWSDQHADLVPPVVAQTGKEAQLILAQYTNSFSGIFINPDITDPSGISVVRAAHHYHPVVPIFFLYNSEEKGREPRFTAQELRFLGVQDVVYKPVAFSDLIKKVSPNVRIFDPKDAVSVGHADPASRNEIFLSDEGFFPVRTQNFLSGSKSFFDVYIRLDSGRYLKLLKAGDSFSTERVIAYMQKGVTHFYLRKEAQEHYLNYCDKLVAAILKSKQVSVDIKITQTFHHGEETLAFLRKKGIDRDSIEYAVGFVENVEQLVNQLNLKHYKTLKHFLDSVAAYEHGTCVSIIAALLARSIEIEYDKASYILGLGSLLHDVGMFNLPQKLADEDESSLTADEMRIYQTHPMIGSEVLAEVSGLDPMICQIVEQHHERRTRMGFPKQLGAGSILQFAEIIGISDELVRLIHKQKKDETVEPFFLMINVLNDFSPSIGRAFHKTFFGQNPPPV